MDKTDGYCGHWHPEMTEPQASSKNWPLKTAHRATVFSMLRDEYGIFHWTCKECGEVISTETYVRPKHEVCKQKP